MFVLVVHNLSWFVREERVTLFVVTVELSRDEGVKLLNELWTLRRRIGIDTMDVISFDDDRVQRHVDVLHAIREGVLEYLVDVVIVNEQHLPFGT